MISKQPHPPGKSANGERDRLFLKKSDQIREFKFDERVARVFPDMIARSVPGYRYITEMMPVFAERFAQPDSRCYDLGASLGAATRAFAKGVGNTPVKIYAIDNSVAMVRRMRHILSAQNGNTSILPVCADIRSIKIDKASVVILNFTLQFVEPSQRFQLLQTIYEGLLPGGVLILSEKITFENEQNAQILTDLHHGFKRFQGYSALEISRKRSALERVLTPETSRTHFERLFNAGFSIVEQWFQSFNFISIYAVK